jgi:hypothetical protein
MARGITVKGINKEACLLIIEEKRPNNSENKHFYPNNSKICISYPNN